jgi:chemotaxis protein CheD
MIGQARDDTAMDSLFLHPGELYAGRRPLRIRTILGSCVAITLWHPGTLMAAMCHYVLAARLRQDPVPGPRDCDGRYGTDALQFLQSAALATDRNLLQFQVGVFGGSTIHQSAQARMPSVGACNIELARRRLQAFGFRLSQLDVGGTGSRVLELDTLSGVIKLKYHSNQPNETGRTVSGRW